MGWAWDWTGDYDDWDDAAADEQENLGTDSADSSAQ